MTTGPQRSSLSTCKGWSNTSGSSTPTNRPGAPGASRSETAALNRQIDHLLDRCRLRQLPTSSTSALQSPAVEPSPQLTERR